MWSTNLSTNTQLTRGSHLSRQVKLAKHTAHKLRGAVGPGGTDRSVQMYKTKTRPETEPEENLRGMDAIGRQIWYRYRNVNKLHQWDKTVFYRILYILRSLKKCDYMNTGFLILSEMSLLSKGVVKHDGT